jgi:hypothetical protein
MTKLTLQRAAADNPYLHKDFHGALSTGLIYLQERFGDDAVRRYLHDFAREFYAPLTAAISAQGLPALRAHLEEIYAVEGGEIAITETPDMLLLQVAASPAIAHMRAQGYPVAPLFGETTRTVLAAICEGTPFALDVLEYDDTDGACRLCFTRRRP